MTFEEKDVRQEVTKVKYEVLNMLGDIGGIMGITIGFSIHMICNLIVEFIYKNILKLCNILWHTRFESDKSLNQPCLIMLLSR